MTVDTLGMIRRGWQDGAATIAPQVGGLTDLLEKRLAEAVRVGALDEISLLAIVDAAIQLTANSGAVEVVPALSKRLRRHVYEYLLSLDAAADEQAGAVSASQPYAPEGGGLLIGADEVAALRRDGSGRPSPSGAPPPAMGLAPERAAARDGASARSPNLPSPTAEHGRGAVPPAPAGGAPVASPAPRFSFHIGDPEDLLSSRTPAREESDAPILPELFAPSDLQPPAPDAAPRRASFADPSTWPRPLTPTLRGNRGQPSAQAWDASEEPSPPSEVGPEPGAEPEPEPDAPGLRDQVWPSPAQDLVADPSDDDHALPPPPPASPGPGAADPPALRQASGPLAATSAAPSWHAAAGPHAPGREGWHEAEAGPRPAWQERGRDPVALHLAPAADSTAGWPPAQAAERDITPLRASVEERLRKKRCDDAAALLQRAAQELGGQAVAELALDAGDRCRTLGKRNAALNCYLAASRADPVYEAPLARLADICIDDQDNDLAVSYLERIARLTRLRGDQRGAMRIYRRIASIAPYRDDVLEMLMRAQTGGQIDG